MKNVLLISVLMGSTVIGSGAGWTVEQPTEENSLKTNAVAAQTESVPTEQQEPQRELSEREKAIHAKLDELIAPAMKAIGKEGVTLTPKQKEQLRTLVEGLELTLAQEMKTNITALATIDKSRETLVEMGKNNELVFKVGIGFTILSGVTMIANQLVGTFGKTNAAAGIIGMLAGLGVTYHAYRLKAIGSTLEADQKVVQEVLPKLSMALIMQQQLEMSAEPPIVKALRMVTELSPQKLERTLKRYAELQARKEEILAGLQ